ncbi:MAG: pyridoxamine 5'-phosphate oxidase [Gemmatimonadales bacterium]|nr:pyridoxamine 5'-phosphate oxidase [Gemmatimonadales bacterium]
MDLGDLREDYRRAALEREALDADPLRQFGTWFDAAVAAGVPEPNAMSLATVDTAGQPSVRIVLLKGVSDGDFVFFTDYRSRKGRDLDANPRAALCFHWHALERQVRVRGQVRRLEAAASADYYRSRPRGSQLGAWVSVQSTPIPDRDVLVADIERRRAEFGEGEIPLPPHWGGYRLTPADIEFWQGRPDRLHDRFLYTRTESAWDCVRLSP